MPNMEWEVVGSETPTYPPEPRCEFEGRHTYKLAIEEGHVVLFPVEECAGWNRCWYPETHEIEMDSKYSPTFILKTNRECWKGYKPTHGTCDHDFWVELVPV